MERVEQWVERVARVVSRLLDPVMAGLVQLADMIRAVLDQAGLPDAVQAGIVAAAWLVPVLLLLRSFGVWGRLIVLVVVGVVAARGYGVLPG